MDSAQQQQQQQQQQQPPSMPWTIGMQPPPGQTGVVRRNSVFQQEKWALKSCYQCHAMFLPAPPNHDVEFCSGDCRFSCSIMRHTKAKKMKTKQAQGAGKK